MKNFKKFNAKRKWKVGFRVTAVFFFNMVRETCYWLECVNSLPTDQLFLSLDVCLTACFVFHVFLSPSVILCPSCSNEHLVLLFLSSSVARNGTLGVHQKNWVCHIYCQINVQKNQTLRNRTDWADIATHNSGSLRAPPDSSCAPSSSTGYFFFL